MDPVQATIIIAIIAALPPTILAFASWRQTKRNSNNTHELRVKADHIHSLVNGSLGELKQELANAQRELGHAQLRIAELNETVAALTLERRRGLTSRRKRSD